MKLSRLFPLLLLLVPAAAHAQLDRVLPQVRYFRTPVADPTATRITAGLLTTNLLETQGPERPAFTVPDPEDSRRDVVAAVSIGAILPVYHISEGPDGGLILYADGKVFARFRVEYPSRDDMGQDWFIGGGLEGRRGPWSGRLAFTHRSSHLGDEFALLTGAQRIEFGSEQIDVMAGYDVPGIGRVYGGGAWIFRSYLGWEPLLQSLDIDDRALLQLGADGDWPLAQDPRLRVYAGVDVHAAERTGWEPGVGAAIGIGVQKQRSLRLMTRFYDGLSPMGEFFLTPERYWVVELVAEF